MQEEGGIIKVDFLQMRSLKELTEYMNKAKEKEKELKAAQRLKEENDLFNDFIETGKVKPYPTKKPFQPEAICRTTKIGFGVHQQTVRKLFMPKNPKRKFRI